MRYFVISDNSDTLTGLRMAGIEGVLCHTREETLAAILAAEADETIGILLINEKLSALCPERVDALKRTALRPLLVEIPDRHHTHRAPDSITRYIREAIGIKVWRMPKRNGAKSWMTWTGSVGSGLIRPGRRFTAG